jgi:hypothetical protein
VPQEVMNVLRNDKEIQSILERDSGINISASWFVASEISLNTDDFSDLVVGPADERLLGANLAPFWIFQGTPQGYILVLKVNTLVLNFLDSKTNGFCEIRTEEVAAGIRFITIYSHDGGKYVERDSFSKPIG